MEIIIVDMGVMIPPFHVAVFLIPILPPHEYEARMETAVQSRALITLSASPSARGRPRFYNFISRFLQEHLGLEAASSSGRPDRKGHIERRRKW